VRDLDAGMRSPFIDPLESPMDRSIMNRRAILLAAAALVAAATGLFLWQRVPPPAAVAYGKDTCGYCLMILSEPGFAAAAREADGTTRLFDDIGCLVEWLQVHGRTGEGLPELWVEEHATGEWLPLAEVVLVKSPSFGTPMTYGILAVAPGYVEQARAKAGDAGMQIVTLEHLLAQPRRGT
jgi:hypothetical protein